MIPNLAGFPCKREPLFGVIKIFTDGRVPGAWIFVGWLENLLLETKQRQKKTQTTQRLEDECPFGMAYFQRAIVSGSVSFMALPTGTPHQRSRRLAYEPLGFPFTDHFTKGFNDKNYLAFMGIISSVAAWDKDPDVHLPGFDFVHMFYWFFGWVSTHSSRHLFSTNIVATFLRTHLPNIPRNPLISANIGAFSGGKHWRWHP